jgi:2-aminoethylphosphonate-pyruvate transaminase
MVTTAVILAAGLGSRLKERTREIPKGFVEVAGRSMVERSLKKLRKAGITRVVIGTGYLAHFYEALAEEDPAIVTAHNPRFAQTGSMYTLYCLKELLSEGFLLLESDLLYEQEALTRLLSDSRKDIILASGMTHSGDEVFMEWTNEGQLVGMSKKPEHLHKVNGELVGICKISADLYAAMCQYTEAQIEENPGLHYEDVLVGLAAKRNIPVLQVEDLAWCEIDDEAHMQRALNHVLPLIEARETVR